MSPGSFPVDQQCLRISNTLEISNYCIAENDADEFRGGHLNFFVGGVQPTSRNPNSLTSIFRLNLSNFIPIFGPETV